MLPINNVLTIIQSGRASSLSHQNANEIVTGFNDATKISFSLEISRMICSRSESSVCSEHHSVPDIFCVKERRVELRTSYLEHHIKFHVVTPVQKRPEGGIEPLRLSSATGLKPALQTTEGHQGKLN